VSSLDPGVSGDDAHCGWIGWWGMMTVVLRVLFIGPTSRPWTSIEADVNADLERLARPGVELAYRCTGTGPADIRSATDARAAAPGVVAAVLQAEAEGFEGVVVDCTEDPGVVEAGKLVTIPVVGPGLALERAAAVAATPVVRVSGHELRSLSLDELTLRTTGAATVVLDGTGWSHVAEAMTANQPDLVVLDPLAVALDACMARLTDTA
jgi:Asp/Glu/hydantoin racemase